MGLDRKQITEAALDLLDQTGVQGLTMRKLADALNVQAPALYWHFSGKPALLDEMAEALLDGISGRISTSGDYRVVLGQIAVELRQALLARRDGARVFAGTFTVRPNVLGLAEGGISALRKAGFDAATAARVIFSVVYYVLGFVIEEQALLEQTRDAVSVPSPVERLTPLSAVDYPNLAAAMPELQSADQDDRFDFGVRLLLRGLVMIGN